MNILLCHDGTREAEHALRFLTCLLPKTAVGSDRVTFLGVAEHRSAEPFVKEALARSRDAFAVSTEVVAELVVRVGNPTSEIVAYSAAGKYDLVVIGAKRKGNTGLSWRAPRVYELIKAIVPPVLLVVGEREKLGRVLVCSGGKRFINEAVRLTARLTAPAGAIVTLLHVLPEPPALYASLPQWLQGPDQVLDRESELSQNLRAQCETFVAAGLSADVLLRRGLVPDEISKELHEQAYDLAVVGTTRAFGPFRRYVMGDVTREVINRANCPLLIVRTSNPRSFLPAGTTTAAGWLAGVRRRLRMRKS